jgi:hypothetical protein
MSLIDQQAALKRAIVQGGDAPGVRGRLPVYQQAYAARLTAALRDNFGVVPRVFGDEAFEALAHAYVAAHPSHRPSIRWFGDRLPEFMAARDDLVPHPALIDLARLEWALRGAFDAADAEPLAASDLAQVPADEWPALVFAVVPGLQLLPLHWNVGPVWRALQGDEDPELPEPEALAHTVLVWRQGLSPRWRALDGRTALLLQRAADGLSFGDLCACAARDMPDGEAASFVAGTLRGWIGDGLLARPRSPG